MFKALIKFIGNLFRSYRLSNEDVKTMSRRGYSFDEDKGRFVK
jgi:hypothetical protein